MNNFGQIVYNVGIRVGDTSTAFSGIISTYVNQRYKRIFRKFNWPTLKSDYSFTTVVGTSDYLLPSDFKHELYVYDSTNLLDIKKLDFQELERVNTGAINSTGSVSQYAIYQSLDTSSPPNIKKTLRLYQIPNSVFTIQMPYLQAYAPLVNQVDLFTKAADFDMQYEQTIQEMIWEVENDPNRLVQFRPTVYDKNQLYGEGEGYYSGV